MVIFLKPIVRMEFVSVRTHGRIMRHVMREMMQDHVDDVLPLHFIEGAENVYHMQRRTQKYLRMKLKKKGHLRPLVFSGRMFRELTSARQRITATQTRSRFYFRNYFALTYDRRKEVETVLQREIRAMERNARRRYAEECRKPENKMKRRSRSHG